MCTAITFKTKDMYFGRNLDLEYHLNEKVIITPRDYPFNFCKEKSSRFAIIGIGIIENDYPLYYDAVNEKGLSVAGLNFPGNAVYNEQDESKINIASFEFIPWLLFGFDSIDNAMPYLARLNITDTPFSKSLPPSPLHWIIADKDRSITLEAVSGGVQIYENPIGILTNNPTFDMQMFNLNNYINLSAKDPENTFSEKISPNIYSRGLGALGLPGDLSSMSRFVRAAFTKLNSVSANGEDESVTQFFHVLSSVAFSRGTVKVGEKDEITLYSSCCNTDKGIYYYTTYENQQITAVDMHKEKLDADKLISYPLARKQNIFWQN